MPTLPGPISHTPLLQAKFDEISVGGAGGGDSGCAEPARDQR
jgi:hypothetical protein